MNQMSDMIQETTKSIEQSVKLTQAVEDKSESGQQIMNSLEILWILFIRQMNS